MYLQCSKYTFLSNFTQTMYRWIHCIRKLSGWHWSELPCESIAWHRVRHASLCQGVRGQCENKTKSPQKRHGKALKPTKQEGPLASTVHPSVSLLPWGGRGPRTGACRAGTRGWAVLGCWADEDRALATPPEAAAPWSPRWPTRARPWGWSGDKIGTLRTTHTGGVNVFLFKKSGGQKQMMTNKKNNKKSRETSMNQKHTTPNVFYKTSDFAKWATCYEHQNFSCRWQVRGPKGHLLSQGKHTGARSVVHFSYLEKLDFPRKSEALYTRKSLNLASFPVPGCTGQKHFCSSEKAVLICATLTISRGASSEFLPFTH